MGIKQKQNGKARAIAYLRVSSDGQAESGLGLEAQEAAIRAAAARARLDLVNTYRDAGLSGSLGIEDRPGLFAAIQDLRRGDVLLVAKRDRIGRDVVLVALIERMVQRKGARILSAAGEGTEGDDASSVLQRRILDAFSEYERLIIGQRTKAALRAKRQRGERAGNVPYGFRLAEDRKTLVANPLRAGNPGHHPGLPRGGVLLRRHRRGAESPGPHHPHRDGLETRGRVQPAESCVSVK